MAFKRSKKNAAPEKPVVRHLGPNLTFLDVVRDACARGGRFTCAADSGEARYQVLVDSGGPFNVSGGGLVGSEALIAAARLTSGTYSITEGWPVAQPVYQIGLDTTLRNLVEGRVVFGEREQLPEARGVDALRSPARATPAVPPPTRPITTPAGVVGSGPVTAAAPRYDVPFAPGPMPAAPSTPPALTVVRPTIVPEPAASITAPQPVAPPPAPAVAPPPPALAVAPPAPVAAPAPAIGLPPLIVPPPAPPAVALAMPAAVSPPAESIAVGLPPVLAPSAAPVPAAAPPPSAAPPPPPALVAEIAIMPVPTELGSLREPTRTWQNAETALVASVTPPHEPRLDPLLPGELTASQNQGSFKHAMTQALLWLMTIDEPQRYTLPQARAITIRAMRSWLIGLFDPIRGQVGRRVQRAREDWEKSGEVVAKQKARQQRRQREVDVDPQAGPLSGR